MISCWGIHHIDIAQWGNGTDATGPSTVEGTGEFPKTGSCDAILSWKVRFEYANAAPMTFVGPGNGVRFVGDAASVLVRRGKIQASDDKLLRDPKNKYDTMPVKLPISKNHEKNFIEAIKNRTRAICDIEAAVRSDTLCQIALIAVKQGRKLKWDPKAEHFVKDDAANAMLKPRTFRGDWKLQKV
jgi:predicted dehydrogenase